MHPIVALPIHTRRLTLRMLRSADATDFAAYRCDPDVARYQEWELPFTLEAANRLIDDQAHVDGPTAGMWVQVAVDLGTTLAGDVAVGLDPTGTEAQLGYTLAPAHRGVGIASEAAAAMVDHLFRNGVTLVRAGLDPANEPSRRVLERLGFSFVRRSERSVFVRGAWCDDEVWAREAPTRM